MTLIEVLVAASVLMVGVWAVATGFPTLMSNITSEQNRTQATRLADDLISNLRQSPGSLPGGIRGPVTIAATIGPDTKPADPTLTTNPPNSRDDIYEIEGETLQVPAPAPGSNYALLSPRQGLIDTAAPGLVVYSVTDLQRMAYVPDPPATSAPDGCFYLASNGRLFVPAGYDGARVNYVWVDSSGGTHWVEGERLLFANQGSAPPLQVQPAFSPPPVGFANTLVQPARCEGLKAFTVVTSTTPAPGQVCVEPNFGGGLIFNQADSGKTVLLDYTLRLDNGKRAQYLIEDHTLGESISQPDNTSGTPDPTKRLVTVQLGWGNLEQLITPPKGSSTPAAMVLAIDMVSGDEYYSSGTTGVGMLPLTMNDVRSGQVVLQVPATSIGHLVRFFYNTSDQASLEVYKPPTNFMDTDTAAAYTTPADFAWRTWELVPTTGGGNTVLQFAPCNLGYSVAIDYVYDTAAGPRLVTGELHTLGPDSTGNHALCTLNHVATEIRAVHGASVRVRAWWLTPKGTIRDYNVETLLPASGAM